MQIFAKRRLISGRKARRQKWPETKGQVRKEKLGGSLGVGVPRSNILHPFIFKTYLCIWQKYATFFIN